MLIIVIFATTILVPWIGARALLLRHYHPGIVGAFGNSTNISVYEITPPTHTYRYAQDFCNFVFWPLDQFLEGPIDPSFENLAVLTRSGEEG